MFRCFKSIFFTLLLLSQALVGEDWSLQDTTKGWNSRELVSLYFHNSELQTQWAWEALSHYSFTGNEKVLDFGSGDGKLSALMSFMVPQGSVTGADLSEEMVRFSSKMFPPTYYNNLNFIQSKDVDCKSLSLHHKFDLITSFCVFHLVPSPIKALNNLKRYMHQESKLVMTFPIGGNPQFFQAASVEMTKRGWEFPMPTAGTISMRDPSKVAEIIREAGYGMEYFKVINTRNSYSSKKELIDFFEGTMTANWDIPLEGRREFFSDLVDRYLDYRPEDKDDDGFVYFSINRIDLIASPKF